MDDAGSEGLVRQDAEGFRFPRGGNAGEMEGPAAASQAGEAPPVPMDLRQGEELVQDRGGKGRGHSRLGAGVRVREQSTHDERT